MVFDKEKIVKIGMTVLGLGLPLAANFVNGKNQDAKMEETIEKKVAEALAAQAKES